MQVQPTLKDILRYPQGYTYRVAETCELKVHGMTCGACVRRVERALGRVPGVEQAVVNYAVERATVLGPEVDPQALVQAITDAGYGAELITADTPAEFAEEGDDPILRRDLIGALALTLPIFIASMFWHPRPYWVNLLIAAATTPVVFYFGARFLRNAWQAAKHREATMDTLIALGSFAAWAFSLYGLIRYAGHPDHHVSDHIYFETAAVTVSLILLGRTLEARARKQMSSAIRGLAGLTPKTATLIGKDGVEIEIESSRIAVGDLIRVRLGGHIPADGEVVESTAYVDESMVTGEAKAVHKKPGDEVTGGSVVSSGLLTFRASRVGQATTLAQIMRAVERAQGSKASAQRMADKVAGVFVPIVIAIALAALAFWLAQGRGLDEAMVNAVAVLLVACPCALGLATPAAIMVGTGRAAELGVLVRDGISLERAGTIQTILTDKTGTLTEGKPRIVSTSWRPGIDGQSVLNLSAALERLSTHPIGQAIRDSAPEAPESTVSEFEEIAGEGVVGVIGAKRLAVGNVALMRRLNIEVGQESGSVLFAVDGNLAGSAEIADPIRPQAANAVSTFKKLGIEVAMLTGDRRQPAEGIAQAVGISQVFAEAKPKDKLTTLEKFKREGKRVAMIGDGVNDAPALAAADLGIAMGSGTDIAMHTADMTLLRSDLDLASTAIRLARATQSVIKWNLVWAFGYNVLMIPLAFSGKLNPMLAAGAMAFSSLSVVLNSLRLKRFK